LTDLVPTRIYLKLLSASYLDKKRIRIIYFTDLVDFLCREQLHNIDMTIETIDETLLFNLKDLTEKLGFVVLSYDILRENKKLDNEIIKLPDEVRGQKFRIQRKTNKFRLDKYYWYNFIIYTKACLDSIAVTLNSFFGFGFVGGQIDFGKAKFVMKVSSLPSFAKCAQVYGKWVQQIVDYRDAIIHQKSIDIMSLTRNCWAIPIKPLTMQEHDELELKRESLKEASQKRIIDADLKYMNLNSFMKKSIEELQNLIGLLSTDVLRELQRKYPDHKPSSTHYRFL
jgi:hypothetical protein